MRTLQNRIARVLLATIIISLTILTDVVLADGGHGHGIEGLLDNWVMAIGGLFLLGSVATVPAYRRAERTRTTFTPLHFGAVLLALFSGAVHLYLFLDHGEVIMLFAGLGFFGGVILLFLGVDRRRLYPLGVAFTAVQILLWVVDGLPHVESFGLIDKVAQVLLIVLLGYLYAGD